MNTRKEKAGAVRLMAAIAVLAVAFVVLAAIPAVADDSDAAGATYYVDGTVQTTGDGSEKTPFKTITEALAEDDVSKIVLKGNVTEIVTISKEQVIILDLNGKTLANDEDKRSEAKAVIVNNGTLTIMDSGKTGTVNATNSMVAIANVGILTIESGKFTNTAVDSGDKKYVNYLLNNSGIVTINGGSFVMDDGMSKRNSSILKNGWTEPKETEVHVNDVDAYGKDTSRVATMTIAGGTFQGPTYVKNDNHGVMNITGGSFITTKAADGVDWSGNCIFNGGELTVTGGIFDNTASVKAGAPFYVYPGSTTVVSAGTYKINDKYLGTEESKSPLVRISGDNNDGPGDLSISIDAAVVSAFGERPVVKTVPDSNYKNLGQAKISVGANSIDIVASDITSGGPTFKYSDGKLIADKIVAGAGNNYVSGKVQIGNLNLSGTLIISKNSDIILPSGTSGTNIVNLGGTVKDVEGTAIKAEKNDVDVSTLEDLNKALSEGADVKIADSGITLQKGDEVVVSGSTISGKLTYGSDSVLFSSVKGDFKVYGGNSIDIDATKIEGTITNYGGAVQISGKITGDLIINSGTQDTKTIKFADVTVNSGVTLTLKGTNPFVVVPGTTFNLYGFIKTDLAVGQDTISIDVQASDDGNTKAAFKAFSGAQIPGTVMISGEGSIDLSKAQSPQTVGEDISYDKTYGQLENVTVVGSLTIKNGATVTVLGGFQVDKGVVLTIQKGSTLVIDSVAASMIVDGSIVVEDGGTLTVTHADDVVVSGSVASEGTVTIASKVTVKSGGSILIDEGENSEVTVSEGLTIESGATLTVRAAVNGATAIDNKGAVVLDGAVLGGTLDVKLLADSAVLDVKSVSGNKAITVTDANKIEFTPGANATVKGLVLTEKVSSYVLNGTTYYTNTVVLSGSVSSMYESTSVALSITATGKNLAVDGTLDLGKNVALTVAADSVLAVSGTVTATAESSSITSNGMIKVSGLIQTKAQIASGISAAMYKTGTSGNEVYNYTTLKAAVDASAKDIAVLGEIAVGESLTIPAGVTVKAIGATIVVGSDDDNSVVLTVDASAVLKDGTIDVKGTLVFDDKKSDKTSEILSDVSVIGEKAAKYTNLVTALNGAQSGDVVTIDRDEVQLKSSVVVKEGVTLDVPNSKKIVLGAGVTLTVDGTLRTAEKVGTVEGVKFSDVATAIGDEKTAAIVVNGVFMSMSDLTYEIYKIPGAYYSLVDDAGSYNYVTTVEKASKTSAVAIGIYGKVSAGDVAFAGTDSSNVAVAVYGELVASSIALDKATFSVDAAAKFTGTVKVADAAVAVKLVKEFAVSIDDGVLCVEKAFAADAKSSSFKVSAGSVEIHSASMNVAVAEGAKLVSCDTQSNIAGKLTVDGSVEVANGQTIVVDGDVVVNGLLSVATPTDTEAAPGVFSAERIFVGVDASKTTGAEASVSGPVQVEMYVVAVVGTLSDATVESLKFNGELVATTYVVEDADWIVVYDRTGDMQIGAIKKAPVENAKFNEIWNDSKGTNVNDKLVGAVDKVYADVKYDIYTIQVVGCKGVENIAVDGILLNGSTDVKTGAHEITCTVSGGYGGDVKLTLVSTTDKTVATVSGKSVTVSGEAGTVVLQITGVTAVTPDTPDPTPIIIKDEDDGMSLTDILLIVLVVLIVIMAAIVALRMMRS